jgi:hypothetical protein
MGEAMKVKELKEVLARADDEAEVTNSRAHVADGAVHGGGGGARVKKVGPDPNAVGPDTSFKRSSEQDE